MNLIACLFTLNPPNHPTFSQGSQREQEFVEGFRRLKQLYEEKLSDDFTVLLVENSVLLREEVPQVIQDEWHEDWFFLPTNCNEFGPRNKGAGIVENWQWLTEMGILADYEWLVHFEPRLSLKDGSFFEEFQKSPRSLFSPAAEKQYFTGLFSMKTDDAIHFSKSVDLGKMVEHSVSFENLMYSYMSNKPHQVLDNVGCLWHDAYAGVSRDV